MRVHSAGFAYLTSFPRPDINSIHPRNNILHRVYIVYNVEATTSLSSSPSFLCVAVALFNPGALFFFSPLLLPLMSPPPLLSSTLLSGGGGKRGRVS